MKQTFLSVEQVTGMLDITIDTMEALKKFAEGQIDTLKSLRAQTPMGASEESGDRMGLQGSPESDDRQEAGTTGQPENAGE